MDHYIFFCSVIFITLAFSSGADREVTVTVNIEDSCFLPCSPFEDLENITIDWYRCSPENGPCDKHRNHIPIVHVKNMTQKNFYYPNLDIYPNGTLVIKKLLPMDDGVKFICSATKDYVGRKTWITILNITKGPPELIPLCPPVIHVIEGMDLHIDATVHGYPYPWVTWSHNKVLIGNKSIENNETSHIIRNVTVYEGGSYSCFANNRYGAVLFTVNVYVQEKGCTPTQMVLDFSPLHPSQKVMTTVASSIPSPPSSPTPDIQTLPPSPTPETQSPSGSPPPTLNSVSTANCECPYWLIYVLTACFVIAAVIIACLGVKNERDIGSSQGHRHESNLQNAGFEFERRDDNQPANQPVNFT